MFNFNLPTKVFIGEQVVQMLPKLLGPETKHILFVTSEDVISYAGDVEAVLTNAGAAVTRLLIEDGEPSCTYIDSKADELKSHTFDVIVGLGGGSALDLSKALAIALKNPEPIWNYANLSNRPPSDMESDPLPVIALPTTAGTGSDVTPYAVLGKKDTKQKGTVQDHSIFPRYSLIDPNFHVSMPPSLTASTGIDAFAHAFEAYINVSKYAPAAEWAGVEAIRQVFLHLDTAYQEPENLEARTGMAWASTLAGIAISHRGTTTPHAIAEPMGALFNISHGLAVSICTLPILSHSIKAIEEKLTILKTIISGSISTNQSGDGFMDSLESLINKLELNLALKDITEVYESTVDLIFKNVMKFKFRPLKQHPVEFDTTQLKTIINEIVIGR